MLLDRHRIARLIELSALERTLSGPERMLREQDVALLIKAAYDDASDAARAAFMTRVGKMPTSAWPWSAVQAASAGTRPRGGGGIGNVAVPQAVVPTIPAALILLRGQVDSADAEPSNRLPDRDTSVDWEPLHKALDGWNTAMIQRWIGPQGWVIPGGSRVPKDGQDAGATSGAPGETTGGTPGGGTGLPAPQSTGAPPPLWKQPAVVAAGAAALVVTGVTVYALTRDSAGERLAAEMDRQAREAARR